MVLSLKSVNKSYNQREVLKNLDLNIFKGDLVAIEGPSGSGKSTLLNLCGALDTPDSGEILLNNQGFQGLKDRELALIRNQKIGFVFQEHLLLPQCTVLENVLIPTIPLKRDETNYGIELLKSVGLGDRLNSPVNILSTGECQRVAVARALINRPLLLLADEPTGSLDKSNSENLAQLLKRINRERGITIISVTHSDSFASHMSRRFTLSDGRLSEKAG